MSMPQNILRVLLINIHAMRDLFDVCERKSFFFRCEMLSACRMAGWLGFVCCVASSLRWWSLGGLIDQVCCSLGMRVASGWAHSCFEFLFVCFLYNKKIMHFMSGFSQQVFDATHVVL